MKLNEHGAVDVESIPDLQHPLINDHERAEIQDLYDAMTNYAVRWQQRFVRKKYNFECHNEYYFAIKKDYKLIPFTKIVINENNGIQYEIVDQYLKGLPFSSVINYFSELDSTQEEAETLAIKYIFTPTTPEKWNCMFSIFDNPFAHFHILETEVSLKNDIGFVCIPVKNDVNKFKADDISSDVGAYLVESGFVIIG